MASRATPARTPELAYDLLDGVPQVHLACSGLGKLFAGSNATPFGLAGTRYSQLFTLQGVHPKAKALGMNAPADKGFRSSLPGLPVAK